METYVAFVGIDWADQKHAVCLVDPQQPRAEHSDLEQQPAAIDEWATTLRRRFPNGPIAVCLEQSRGALIYALMKYDFLVLFPVNPLQLARFREALEPSGAKDDPDDAQLLAELLQKHGDRLRAWKPDDVQTRLLRLLVEDRRGLVDQRTAFGNALKSRLKQYYPLALDMFDDVTSNLACALLMRWSSFDSLRAASEQELREFYRAAACWHADAVKKRLAAWRVAQSLTGDRAIVESGQLQSGVLVRQIVELNRAIGDYEARIAQLMEQHNDGPLFQSFPGAGAALAPRLLAAFGSDRDRLDDAQQMQRYAGIAPVTKRSGKSHRVVRRWACKTFLLQTFHEFAGQSIKQSLWARAYYQMMRERGSKHQAAVRALAFKWIRIVHRCWKSRQCYDEPTYLAALKQRSSPINKYLYPTCQETQP